MILQLIVDDEKYNLIRHEIVLSTTEYTFGTTVLAIQIISIGLNKKIKQSLQTTSDFDNCDQVRYYISKTYNSKCEPIKQSAFFDKFNELQYKKYKTVQEICEHYHSADRNGNLITKEIAVLRANNEITRATIEFKNEIEMEDFVLPEWLSPIAVTHGSVDIIS